MNWLRDVPIKRKLTLVIVATCAGALVLACIVLAAYQLFDIRHALERDMTVLANVISKTSRTPLTLKDKNSAEERLQALQAEPAVTRACVYDVNGDRFASFPAVAEEGGIVFPGRPEKDGVRFENGRLRIFRPILVDATRAGTLFLETDMRGLKDRLVVFGWVAAVVIIGSCCAAFVLSFPIQRSISGPIFDLAATVQQVAEQKNYSIQLPPAGGPEIGKLTTAFTHLLQGIEERDKALRTRNEELRQEVTERRAADERTQAQLARLEMMYQITRAIGERQDLRSIFQVVIRTLEDHLPLDFCAVAMYTPEANSLTVTSVGVRSEVLAMDLALTERSVVPIDENGLSQCVRGRLVYEPDIGPSEYPFPARLAKGGLRSLVAAPLLVESHVFGVLVAARRQPESFSSGECEFLRQLSEHVALAAHQAQIYTALQQAYDDLRQTQQAVMQQERLRALGQMASGIAHDINNAISPVALYTESLLEQEPGLSTRAREYLETIQHAIEDVTHTVARMREFYRQREPQLTLVPVQVNSLVKQAIDLSRARWSDMPQQRGVLIEMKTELAPALPAVLGLESEIREALVNLIFNAVDAMPSGGTLTLRTRVKEPPAASSASSTALVEVIDTGIGMDEDTRRRCLEPFFTTKGERGTGLGLAMVYGIVRRHNAEIEIESTEGQGTTFRIAFPVPQSNSAGAETSAAAPKIPSRMRILIVDDDPLLLKSLRDALEGDGHLTVAANGGQAGIDAFRKALASEPFDAVITDLGMPGVDGRRVASSIKAASAATPVILLTGWGQRLAAEGDIPDHVDLVLNKPPKLRELRQTLAQCVPQAR